MTWKITAGLNQTVPPVTECRWTGSRTARCRPVTVDTESWKALQRFLQQYWGYLGAIDGIVSTETIKALQHRLTAHEGYTGAIDGIAGPSTREAFKRFAAPKS